MCYDAVHHWITAETCYVVMLKGVGSHAIPPAMALLHHPCYPFVVLSFFITIHLVFDVLEHAMCAQPRVVASLM
jgi:hypothetical protein